MCVKTKKREKYYCIKQLKNNYLELFYVECQGSWKYGESCEIQCPIKRKDNTCHIRNEICFECNKGWAGTTLNIKLVNVQKQKTKALTNLRIFHVPFAISAFHFIKNKKTHIFELKNEHTIRIKIL